MSPYALNPSQHFVLSDLNIFADLMNGLTDFGYKIIILAIKNPCGASLVAQWLRICLLMQETRVRALVWEDPTCHGAAGPVSHSC